MNKIHELFALPIGMEEVASVSGFPLYSSKTIREKFNESLQNSRRGKAISKSVYMMVATGKIIPCYAESGILSYLKKRIQEDTSGGLMRVIRKIFLGKKPSENPLDYVLAFYDFNINKIIVLISNHISEKFSLTASDLAIAISLSHEMMHMYAHENPQKFLSVFSDELTNYYQTYFTDVFKLKKNKELEPVIESIYRYFFLKCEIGGSSALAAIVNQLNKLKEFSTLEEDEFRTVIKEYSKVVKLLLSNDMQKFVVLAEQYQNIINPLYHAYKNTFGKIPVKGCAQEMIFPSEVICGYSDIKVDSKIKTALQSL